MIHFRGQLQNNLERNFDPNVMSDWDQAEYLDSFL